MKNSIKQHIMKNSIKKDLMVFKYFNEVSDKVKYVIHMAIKGRNVGCDYIEANCDALVSYDQFFIVSEKLAWELEDHSEMVFHLGFNQIWARTSEIPIQEEEFMYIFEYQRERHEIL